MCVRENWASDGYTQHAFPLARPVLSCGHTISGCYSGDCCSKSEEKNKRQGQGLTLWLQEGCQGRHQAEKIPQSRIVPVKGESDKCMHINTEN